MPTQQGALKNPYLYTRISDAPPEPYRENITNRTSLPQQESVCKKKNKPTSAFRHPNSNSENPSWYNNKQLIISFLFYLLRRSVHNDKTLRKRRTRDTNVRINVSADNFGSRENKSPHSGKLERGLDPLEIRFAYSTETIPQFLGSIQASWGRSLTRLVSLLAQ